MQLLVNSFLKNENLKKTLVENNIHYKEYPDEGLMIMFNNYDSSFSSPLHNECRSLVVDMNNKKVVNYTCPNPLRNERGIDYLMRHKLKYEIYECYEGSLLSLFNYNGKWYLSTRKCLDASESVWKGEKSHYDQFMEVLNESGYSSIDELTDKLDSKLSYHFVLVHYMNGNYVDYSKEFGDCYKKLVLAYMRDSNMEMVSTDEVNIYDSNIIMNRRLESIKWLDEYNKENSFNLPPSSEGLILRGVNNNKEVFIKLQSHNYQMASAMLPKEQVFSGLLKLYQLDKLKEYLNIKENEKYVRITNPYNPKLKNLTIGVIDKSFKILTKELLNLHNILYDKEYKHKNEELYSILPGEYKSILFNLRGICYRNVILELKDVYIYLKKMDINKLENLLRVRKSLLELNGEKLEIIQEGIDKRDFKMINILTNKILE